MLRVEHNFQRLKLPLFQLEYIIIKLKISVKLKFRVFHHFNVKFMF